MQSCHPNRMRWTSKLAALALAALLPACAAAPVEAPRPIAAAAQREPVTILISIDGFRADYLDRGVTPALSALAEQGVRAAMRPSFPSKTFPNHYAIVTGLRPDRNGIVANNMEDARLPGKKFTMSTLAPVWWDEAEPIWVAAEKAGIRTGTVFWPGSNSKVRATYPADWLQFNHDLPDSQRVDAIVDWLRRPDPARRPRLLTLYFNTVDDVGHDFGPDAPETNAAVASVDAQIGRLRDELAALGQPVNFVVVADHGMAEISEDRVIDMARVADPADYRVVEDGPYASFAPVPGHEAALEARLRKPHPHMRCWPKAEIPARFRYGSNRRIPPWLCLAEIGWTIRAKAPDPEWTPGRGNHGWDHDDPTMRALFVASGPAFVPGKRLESFDNVDVYALLRNLIGLPPANGVDGSDAVFRDVVR
jgi:predicted AlkP superfamily pyrophosphatase or phosphodiesterase